jgi:hypothetical protein
MTTDFSVKTTSGLHGFARGWTIFLIVYSAAFGLSLVRYLTDPEVSGLIAIVVLMAGVMVVGEVMMLKGKAFGFWILALGSVGVTLLNNSHAGRYTLTSSGGLVLMFVTFFIVRKQLGLFTRKPSPVDDQAIQSPK